ncbi:hypothetical protein FMM05_07085 [Flavobacterium zepuense]|uniref:Uncharacterized protein n=1 Tax=Flavobacterium zepuense TaxID=2593302 RepID=A0A552V688_9FLAO|nr:hypothetical protein [Flavobacterium zepuense]TRW25979.1 hypothetical protein FMM05_07085 [Flavobacterium zepuense]
MEIEKLKDVADFAAKIETAQQFNKLKPHRYGNGCYSAELQFGGYNHLVLSIMDIIKVCIVALDAQEDLAPQFHSASNISSVLDIALQLIPMEESQVLDNCYQLHLRLKQQKE